MQLKTRKLLQYWQQLNSLAPVTVKDVTAYNPTKSKNDPFKAGDFLSLPLNSTDGRNALFLANLVQAVKDSSVLELVVGQVQHDRLYNLINSVLPPESHIDIVEADRGRSFVFYLQLDANGYYQEKSLMLSEFLRGVCCLAYPTLDQAQAIADDIPPTLLPLDTPITPMHLQKVLDYILRSLKIESWRDQLCVDRHGRPDWQILLKPLAASESQSDAIMQMDFYSRDLAMLQDADLSGHFLEDFILSRPVGRRRRVDDSCDELTELTLPEHHSAGKWPSQYNPTLMQKVGINIATLADHPPVFSVNGPPGTGKTTLLKEIVANAVVEKAKILAHMASGKSGLKFKKMTTESTNKYTRNYYQIPDEIKAHSIIVASNNNAAVENISRDLPLADAVKEKSTCSDLFDIDQHDEVYFTNKAFDLFNPDNKKKNSQEENQAAQSVQSPAKNEREGQVQVFGLVAAPYGSSKNIGRILDILPGEMESIDACNWGLSTKPDLNKAVSDFNSALKQFEDIRGSLTTKVQRYQAAKQKLETAKTVTTKTDVEEINKAREAYQRQLREVEIDLQERELKLQSLLSTQPVQDKAASAFSKIKSVFGSGKSKSSEADSQIKALKQQVEDLGWKRQALKMTLDKQNEQLSALVDVESEQQKLDALKQSPLFKGSVFDEEIFGPETLFKEKAQTLCPWVTEELNIANERLFHAALQLTKAYICNSKELFQNLKRLKALKGGETDTGYTAEEASRVMVEAFHTLNLLIPVLSTTFASVQTAFSDFGKNDLGMVIIDEAGQATPYSALGLLYRARRCIVVGDPLQVEPILSTPSTLIRMAYHQMGLDEDEEICFEVAGKPLTYASAGTSVQVMADACNPFYGVIGETEVGCPLVVHRRCQSPMFDISNEISYANRMINKAAPPKPDKRFVLERNEWIHDEGKKLSDKNHYVSSQGDEVISLIRKAQARMDDPMQVFEPGKLYVISPFKSVAQGVKRAVRQAFGSGSSTALVAHSDSQSKRGGNAGQNSDAVTSWTQTSVGTVHTFQGKEAECVILVLGSDDSSPGAARWAASKANILNVAVTRAKYRLVIIGDEKLWGELDYFDVAYEKLKTCGQTV